MTLDTFFKKFDQFADAPDAVAKMRELVLQLAVQGKIVSQNPKDEKASILLARIGKTKELLISDRTIRRQETAPIDSTEAPFSIPQSWIWTRLGEIADWGSGSTPSRGNSDLYDGGIAWLKSGELNDNQSLAGSEETVTEKALTTGSFRRNQPGDVLLAMYGATIGKVAILAEPAVTNQAVCGCTPFEGVFNRYLFFYLLSQRARFHSASEGGAQPNISKVKIVAFQFPLPPLAEQKRIVAKVDELMALCDRLEAQQQEREEQASALARASLARFAEAPTPANLNLLFHKSYSISPSDLRKAVLTLAVQGKLVRQDSNEEPAKALLAELDAERQRFAEEFKFRSQVVEVDNSSAVPFTIPTSWKWCRLSSMFNAITDGDHLPPPKSSNGIAFLTIGNITTGTLEFEGCRFVPDSYYQGLADFRRPVRGDILYTVVGATYGRPAFVDSDRPFCVQRHIAILKPPHRIEVGYMMTVLRSPLVYDQATASTTGTAQPTIPLGSLRNFLVPLPPLAEQRRIVAKVNQLMTLVDQMETQLAASRATAKNLLEALVVELSSKGIISSANGASHPSLGHRPRKSSAKTTEG